MKKIFFILALVAANNSYAQSAAPENLNYAANLDMTAGRFDYKLNERETMNVNYSLSPKYPADKAQFSLHTPQPMPFRADIINAKGKVVLNWKPEAQVYLYNTSWDLSKLAAGDYTVRIYMEGHTNSIYSFSFIKK